MSSNVSGGTTEMTCNSTISTLPDDTDSGIPWQRVVLGIVLYLLVFVTVAGNGLVLVAIARDKRLHTVFNVFIVNLAITDIGVGLIAMNFFAAFNILQKWPFGEVLCGLWMLGDFGMTFASIFTLLAISLDRYWSVHWSNHYRVHNNRRKAVVVTVSIWSAMVLLWVPAFAVDRINNSREGECFYDPEKNKAFVIAVAVLGYHGTTVVMLYCYIKVFLFVRRRSKVGPFGQRSGKTTKATPSAVACRAEPRSATVLSGDDTQPNDVNSSDINKGNVASGFKVKHVTKRSRIFVVGENTRPPKFLHPEDAKLTRHDNFNSSNRTPAEANSDHDSGYYDSAKKQASGNNSHLPAGGVHEHQSPNPHKASTSTCLSQGKDVTTSLSSCSTNQKTLRREQKVFLTLTYIMVAYLICWMPFHVSFDIVAVDRTLVPERFYDVTYWLAYCNSAINPFLYNFSSPDFHRAFMKLIRRR